MKLTDYNGAHCLTWFRKGNCLLLITGIGCPPIKRLWHRQLAMWTIGNLRNLTDVHLHNRKGKDDPSGTPVFTSTFGSFLTEKKSGKIQPVMLRFYHHIWKTGWDLRCYGMLHLRTWFKKEKKIQQTLCNIPEERMPQLNRYCSLQPGNVKVD